MNTKKETGNLGEDLAVEYLVSKKYKIIERNYRKPWGEIDIIAKTKEGVLVFVEVKTMRNGTGIDLTPEDQMTSAKVKKFKRTAELFAGEREDLITDSRGWRLDVLAITIPKGTESSSKNKLIGICDIRHYENI